MTSIVTKEFSMNSSCLQCKVLPIGTKLYFKDKNDNIFATKVIGVGKDLNPIVEIATMGVFDLNKGKEDNAILVGGAFCDDLQKMATLTKYENAYGLFIKPNIYTYTKVLSVAHEKYGWIYEFTGFYKVAFYAFFIEKNSIVKRQIDVILIIDDEGHIDIVAPCLENGTAYATKDEALRNLSFNVIGFDDDVEDKVEECVNVSVTLTKQELDTIRHIIPNIKINQALS